MRLIKFCLIMVFAVSLFNASALALPPDSVESHDIREADGISGQEPNIGSGIKTAHIQNGAVTDAKISGQISAAKISSTGLNADTVDGKHEADLASAVHAHPISQVIGLDAELAGKSDASHNHDDLYQKKYGKVTVVAKTGGDFTDPIAAMNNLAAWCGTPSEANPCLVKIMPGVYDLGANSLQMQSYVDIEGSGESNTRLTGTNDGSGVLRGASNAEMRFLSVMANAAGSAIAVYNDGVSPKMTNITALTETGVRTWGVYNNNASPVMTNITIIASGTGTDYSGNHNIAVANLGSGSAPIITNIIATAKDGGDDCYGIFNDNSSPIIMNGVVTANCTGGANGIYTAGASASAKLSGLTVNADDKGVWTRSNSTATMTNVTVNITSNAYYSCAVHSDYSAVLKVDHSILNGGYASLCGGYYGGSVYVANSRLEGASTLYDTGVGLPGQPQAKCINVYDGSYDPLACP